MTSPSKLRDALGMTTLSEELSAKRAWAAANIPPEKLTIMLAATEALRSSGIASRALSTGGELPDVTLPNANSEPRTLSTLLQRGPLVVAFYRGGWCPYCNLELRALQRELPAIRAAGGTLLAITPELPDKSLTTTEKNELQFEVLTDRGNQYARKLGLVFQLPPDLQGIYRAFDLNLPAYNGDDAWELPLPATYVVDQQGIVRYSFVDADYTVRAEPADLVAALNTLNR